MAEYVITKPEVAKIKDGRVRLLFVNKTRRRQSRVGEPMSVNVAKANKQRERVITPVCTYRATVRIDAEGVVRVIETTHKPGDVTAEALHRLFAAAEAGSPADGHAPALKAIAVVAGFKTWPAVYTDALRRARPTRHRADDLIVEVVGWSAPR